MIGLLSGNTIPYVIALIAGLLVKFVDWLDDERKKKPTNMENIAKYIAAVIYGSMIGYLISSASFSALFLAAVIGQVFAKKIDTHAHQIGLIVTFAFVLYLGMPIIELPLLFYFVVLAFLDEVDYVGWLRPLSEYRLILKLGTLPLLLIGRWDYFVAILAFDAGYELFGRFVKKII